MKKKSYIFTLVTIFILFIFNTVHGEGIFQIIEAFWPLLDDEIDTWSISMNQIENYVSHLNGFTCRRILADDYSRDIVCRSDQKYYIGTYKIVFDFGNNIINPNNTTVKSFDVIISHPYIEDDLSSGINSLDKHLNTIKRMIQINGKTPIFESVDNYSRLINNIFSDEEIEPDDCKLADNRYIFCVGSKVSASKKDKNFIAISFSEPEHFRAMQYIDKGEERLTYSDVFN